MLSAAALRVRPVQATLPYIAFVDIQWIFHGVRQQATGGGYVYANCPVHLGPWTNGRVIVWRFRGVVWRHESHAARCHRQGPNAGGWPYTVVSSPS